VSFNAWAFIALFLPVTLLGFALLSGAKQPGLVKLWLIAVSFAFYGWADPASTVLLGGSILFNYTLGGLLRRDGRSTVLSRRLLLTIGIAANLALLGYFKYRNFFLENLGFSAMSFDEPFSLAVPLGLSFLAFQQIAYLVDTYRGEAQGESILDYAVFVTFFPKLIAGPIIRQREFIPQLNTPAFGVFTGLGLAEGITLFTIGLFKKTVLADNLSPFADSIFGDVAAGMAVNCWQAWGAMLAYTFQLYFDFAGYTDMAIGLGVMFGLQLPANFNLPYTADSIREFWRRWHMTFSRFLRDYLYIPLGGSRVGPVRTGVNLLATMLLGGLWHGAGWTFLIWGALHGTYLIINHAWSRLGLQLPRAVAWFLTFVSVAYAWVWFRAESVSAAVRMTSALVKFGDLLPPSVSTFLQSVRDLLPMHEYFDVAELLVSLQLVVPIGNSMIYVPHILLSRPVVMSAWLTLAGLIAFWLPNLFERTSPDLRRPSTPLLARRAAIMGILLYLVLINSIEMDQNAFVYLRF